MAGYNHETIGGFHGALVLSEWNLDRLRALGSSHSHTNGTGSSSGVSPASSMATRRSL